MQQARQASTKYHCSEQSCATLRSNIGLWEEVIDQLLLYAAQQECLLSSLISLEHLSGMNQIAHLPTPKCTCIHTQKQKHYKKANLRDEYYSHAFVAGGSSSWKCSGILHFALVSLTQRILEKKSTFPASWDLHQSGL